MKPRLLLTLLLHILLSILFIAGCGTFEKEVTISKSEIQKMVDAKFPYEKNAVLSRVSLFDPEVYFKGENVGMRLNYKASLVGKEFSGTVDVNGQITYRPDSGTFYLTDFTVADISTNGHRLSNNDKLRGLISNAVGACVQDYRVYSLKEDELKQKMAKLLLKEVKVKGDSLSLRLSL